VQSWATERLKERERKENWGGSRNPSDARAYKTNLFDNKQSESKEKKNGGLQGDRPERQKPRTVETREKLSDAEDPLVLVTAKKINRKRGVSVKEKARITSSPRTFRQLNRITRGTSIRKVADGMGLQKSDVLGNSIKKIPGKEP